MPGIWIIFLCGSHDRSVGGQEKERTPQRLILFGFATSFRNLHFTGLGWSYWLQGVHPNLISGRCWDSAHLLSLAGKPSTAVSLGFLSPRTRPTPAVTVIEGSQISRDHSAQLSLGYRSLQRAFLRRECTWTRELSDRTAGTKVVFFSPCFCFFPPRFVPVLFQSKPWGSSVLILADNKDLFPATASVPHGSLRLWCLVCCRWGACVAAAEVFSCSLASWAGNGSNSLDWVKKIAHFRTKQDVQTYKFTTVGAHFVGGTRPFKSFTNSLQFSEIMILNALRHEHATISLDILNIWGDFSVEWKQKFPMSN